LLYGVPTVLTLGLGYVLWQWKLRQEAMVASAAKEERQMTADDLVFPDVPDPGTLKGQAVGEGTTTLSVDQARIIGAKARRRSSVKAIGYWSSPDTRVVWDVVVTKTGEYEILVIQSQEDSKMGGTFEVSMAGVTASGEARKTASKDQFEEVSVGTIKVDKKGPTTLEIRPTKVIGTSLMNLGGVTIRRK